MKTLRFDEVAGSWPYHAALVSIAPDGQERGALHTHADFWELMFVLLGRGTHKVEGSELPLTGGDLVLVRPHDCHGLLGGGPEGIRLINIAFPASAWNSFACLLETGFIEDWEQGSSPLHISLNVDRDAVAKSFQRALQVYHCGSAQKLDLVQLWTVALPALKRSELASSEESGIPGWLRNACSAMNDEQSLREGLPTFLGFACVSHGHLARNMRKYFGCTPVEYVTERRLAHAALLLATTTVSIGRVADRCGFASLSYFGRCFRARYDCSPRDYRMSASRAVVPIGTLLKIVGRGILCRDVGSPSRLQ